MFLTTTPEQAGVSSENVLRFFKALEKWHLCTHSVIMARGNNIFAESYFAPFHKDFLHRMYSVSKSFVSVAVGLAVEDGLLSLDDTVSSFFPDLSKDCDEALRSLTVRDALKMETGHRWTDWFSSGTADRLEDYFLSKTYRLPGTVFEYDSPVSFMLCAIVKNLTGKPFLEYLKERFLLKAGFSKDAYCLTCRGGHSFGDSGVMCTARDLLVFARFVMDGGKIDGVPYMNGAYLTEATKKQVSNCPDGAFGHNRFGYGYQIWKAPNDGFAFIGMGDQFAICDRQKDFILIITSDNQGNGFSRAILYDHLYSDIIDCLGDPLPENVPAQTALSDYLSSRKLFCLTENTQNPFAKEVDGNAYVLEENPMGITSVSFAFHGTEGVLSYENAQGKKTLRFGLGYNVFQKFPQEGYSDMIAGAPCEGNLYDCAASADWPEERTLRIKVQIIDKYFGNAAFLFVFRGDDLQLHMEKTAEAFLDEYQGDATGHLVK